MYFQMTGFTISGTVAQRIPKKQVVLVSQTVFVRGHFQISKTQKTVL